MEYFWISSKAGVDMGAYFGKTKAQALASMHDDAGISVTIDEEGYLKFNSEEEKELAGDVEDWYFDQYGEVSHEGKKLVLTQYPYIEQNPNGEIVYRGCATNSAGDHYELEWDIVNESCEDESEACDWEDFRVIDYVEGGI